MPICDGRRHVSTETYTVNNYRKQKASSRPTLNKSEVNKVSERVEYLVSTFLGT